MTASDEPQLATRGGVVLRRARRDDLAEIVGLLRDDPLGSARETADLASYAAAYETIEADPAQLLVVVAAGGGLVGTAQLSLIPGLTYQGGTRGQVEGVRVRADRRGQGLGGWLVGWLVEEARRRGCVLVQLTSDSARSDARRFYTDLGFTPSHVGFKLRL